MILNTGSSMLVPSITIHFVDKLPATPLPPDILRQHLERPLRIRITRATDVRRDQDIRRRPQRIVLGQRLWVRHVKRSATNLLSLQRRDQRLLVDNLAPSNIRNIGAARIAFVQELKLVGGEQVGCVLAARLLAT